MKGDFGWIMIMYIVFGWLIDLLDIYFIFKILEVIVYISEMEIIPFSLFVLDFRVDLVIF